MLTSLRKKAIGFLVSGILFIVTGIVFFQFDTAPEWLGIIVLIIGAIAETLGIVIIKPEIDAFIRHRKLRG